MSNLVVAKESGFLPGSNSNKTGTPRGNRTMLKVFSITARCIKSLSRSREINDRCLTLRDGKVIIDTEVGNSSSKIPLLAKDRYLFLYSNDSYWSRSKIDRPYSMFVDPRTHELGYKRLSIPEKCVRDHFEPTIGDQVTFQGWEGFCAVEISRGSWAVYFDLSDNGLKGKIAQGTRALEIELKACIVEPNTSCHRASPPAVSTTAGSTESQVEVHVYPPVVEAVTKLSSLNLCHNTGSSVSARKPGYCFPIDKNKHCGEIDIAECIAEYVDSITFSRPLSLSFGGKSDRISNENASEQSGARKILNKVSNKWNQPLKIFDKSKQLTSHHKSRETVDPRKKALIPRSSTLTAHTDLWLGLRQAQSPGSVHSRAMENCALERLSVRDHTTSCRLKQFPIQHLIQSIIGVFARLNHAVGIKCRSFKTFLSFWSGWTLQC
ncbi:hypothetical protein BS50DRAFT_656617 [Corynespora cassiicola Philippines]|uniref:Uncharacterized protein n=1 Tax=Corynespora cassiicola Philippines TaxID=1448308 RepID=A0A2T2N2U1_CORCC|nr:hypothetical protein BS50DRAFT_656617 [Corynespora cassiicola Philippines]